MKTEDTLTVRMIFCKQRYRSFVVTTITRNQIFRVTMRSLQFLSCRHSVTRSFKIRNLRSKAAICQDIGQPLSYDNWDMGSPSKGCIKIKVAGAGINFGDILQCQGKYQEKRDPPFVPGMECSGTVVEVGDGVSSIQIGDRVVSLGQGAFADFACVPAAGSFVLPRNLPASADLTEAAALLVSYGTAHLALTSSGRAKAGDTVLITASSGGVGLACVELAR